MGAFRRGGAPRPRLTLRRAALRLFEVGRAATAAARPPLAPGAPPSAAACLAANRNARAGPLRFVPRSRPGHRRPDLRPGRRWPGLRGPTFRHLARLRPRQKPARPSVRPFPPCPPALLRAAARPILWGGPCCCGGAVGALGFQLSPCRASAAAAAPAWPGLGPPRRRLAQRLRAWRPLAVLSAPEVAVVLLRARGRRKQSGARGGGAALLFGTHRGPGAKGIFLPSRKPPLPPSRPPEGEAALKDTVRAFFSLCGVDPLTSKKIRGRLSMARRDTLPNVRQERLRRGISSGAALFLRPPLPSRALNSANAPKHRLFCCVLFRRKKRSTPCPTERQQSTCFVVVRGHWMRRSVIQFQPPPTATVPQAAPACQGRILACKSWSAMA